MRELKFRVWDGEKKKWIKYPNKFAQDKDGLYYRDDDDWLNSYFCPRSKQVIQQFTGLKDKNGKEIYEGDMLECPKYPLLSVIFHLACFMVEQKDGYKFPIKDLNRCSYCHPEYKIIGNIFENPEILKI